MAAALRLLGRSLRSNFQQTTRFLSSNLQPLEDGVLEKPVICDVTPKELEPLLASSQVPVVVLMHRDGKDEDTVKMAESVTKVAGRLALAKIRVSEADVPTPTFVISHRGKIVGRATGVPCQDELLPFVLAVRSVLGASQAGDKFMEAHFTGQTPKDYVQERPADLMEES